MRLTRSASQPARPGTVLPMLGICLIGLFGFVALAVDLGMLAVSRTQCQNGADVAALVGTRTLNNKDGVAYNNLPAAVAALKSAVTSNPHLSANFGTAQIAKIEANQYLYNPTSQRFETVEANWVDVTSNPTASTPNGGSWTALRVTLTVSQPTYFMRVFGVTSMPSGARATAAHRPRDVAFVLDMTGSMAYASKFSNNNLSMNPDTMVPAAGHYVAPQNALVATSDFTTSTKEVFSRNNYTISTRAGPPIIRGFYFDPSNISNPATVAYPLTTKADGSPNLLNAFHRWSPPESGGDPNNYVGVTYDMSGYDSTNRGDEASPKGPVPAPASFATMTDSAGIVYAGDRWRRADGSVNKTDTTWDTSSTATKGAATAAELLGYNVSGTDVRQGTSGTTVIATVDKFRDPVWEAYGYDLKLDGPTGYRFWKTNSNGDNPGLPGTGAGKFSTLLAVGTAGTGLDTDRFKGYSMGPGYWGKTFFIWPPDPRWGGGTGTPDPTSPAAPNLNDPAPKDTNGNYICDWRRRFFLNPSILNTGTSGQTLASGAQVNYAAVLKWIKSGPMVLPPNLRAGRVLYYSSIPDDVNTGTGSAQQVLDKTFWKNYIDFVLATGSYTSVSQNSSNLYGPAVNVAGFGRSVYLGGLNAWTGPFGDWPSQAPYVAYSDSPLRPRLHFWFGPLSMVHFLTRATGNNWLPGTCSEAQCWQLKAGMNSVLTDVKNNHPNDYAGLVLFAAPQYNGVRVGMGQNFKRLKSALFYPKSLFAGAADGDVTTEYRPYNTTALGGYTSDEIPNAAGATDPSTGLAYAYNLLSSSTLTAAQAVGAGGGRRGAQKLVIFETDGAPDYARALTFNPYGYNSYYTTGAGASMSQGSSAVQQESFNVIQQIVKPVASTATTGSAGPDSGLSLPNAPARVYPIAFGDLFDEDLAPNATYRDTAKSFLNQCAALGGTGSLSTEQVITGPYQQRIDRLRTCLERIFQGGVSVVLIE